MPRVSVILPCYNAHSYLGEALDSVREQTFRDFEIVIIDDGSTDPATIAFLDALPSDIRVIRQENKGLPAARNAGFRAAAGDYVLPLDCDDWLAPTFLEKTLAALDAEPEAGFAFSHMTLEGELKGTLVKSYNFFEQLFFNQLPYCLLIKRKVFEQTTGYDETMRRGYEDWELNIKLGEKGWFGACHPEPLFHYRVTSAGMLKSTSNHFHAQLWKDIQERHRALYSPSGMFRVWQQWHARPSTYPPSLLVGWYLAYRLLPMRATNALLRRLLRRFSQARRVSRRAS